MVESLRVLVVGAAGASAGILGREPRSLFDYFKELAAELVGASPASKAQS